jgi:hypothetical protein
VHFDGNTFLQSATALGAINSPRGIFSVWCYQEAKGALAGLNGSVPMVTTEDNQSCWLSCPGGGGPPPANLFNGGGVIFYSADGASHYNSDTDDDICPVGAWFHSLIAWDMDFATGSRRAVCYVNGVRNTLGQGGQFLDEAGTAFDVNYDNTAFYIGNYSVSGATLAGLERR